MIGRLAALVVRGLPGHAVVAEDHVVGGEDRAVQIDLVERPGHGTFGLLGQRVGHGGLFLLCNGLGLLFGLLFGLLLLGLLLLWLLLGLLLHDLLLLLLRLSDSLLTVVVVAAADQRQPGRTDAGPRRGPQQRPPRHLVAP